MICMYCFAKKIAFHFSILIICSLPITAIAAEFVIDPKISNNGPIIKLATSDLPKVPLIILNGESIYWEEPGIRIEQMRLVAEMVGVRFAYTRLPWRRALRNVEGGEGDAVFVTGYTEERAEWGEYPFLNGQVNSKQAISRVSYFLYTRRDSPVTWNGNELNGLELQIGADSGDFMTANLKKEGYDVVAIETYKQLVEMLNTNRIDAAVGFRTLVDNTINADPTKFLNIEKHEIPWRKVDGYLLFSKKSYGEKPELIDAIWKSIEQLWEDGTMDSLYEKYQNQS